MKKVLAIISGLVLSGGIALAQQTFEELDLNGDGMLNIEEAASNPIVTEKFEEADADQDGNLNSEEFSAIDLAG